MWKGLAMLVAPLRHTVQRRRERMEVDAAVDAAVRNLERVNGKVFLTVVRIQTELDDWWWNHEPAPRRLPW
jgi:hypothetical protein